MQSISVCIIVGALHTSLIAAAGEIEVRGLALISGSVAESEDVSGIARVGRFLAVCADEGADLNLLRRRDDGSYAVQATMTVDDGGQEIDMEGLAADGNTLYVIGSHSRARDQVRAGLTRQENHERLAEIDRRRESEQLFRIQFSDDGDAEAIEPISLDDLIQADSILGPFRQVPSKENGVDIEGLTVRDGELYVGFRGPVLRDNFVPVMVFEFESPADYDLRFVQLGGHGIRGMATVSNGFLLIGGPVGDGDGTFELYHWNGDDSVPDEGEVPGRVTKLGRLPLPDDAEDAKPEGIELLEEADEHYDVLVVYDGVENGAPVVLRVSKQ